MNGFLLLETWLITRATSSDAHDDRNTIADVEITSHFYCRTTGQVITKNELEPVND